MKLLIRDGEDPHIITYLLVPAFKFITSFSLTIRCIQLAKERYNIFAIKDKN